MDGLSYTTIIADSIAGKRRAGFSLASYVSRDSKLIKIGANVVRHSNRLLNRTATRKNRLLALKNALTSQAKGGKLQERPVKLNLTP